MFLIPVYICQYVLATLAAINGQYLLGWFIYFPPTFSSLDWVPATSGFATTVFFAICLFGRFNSRNSCIHPVELYRVTDATDFTPSTLNVAYFQL